MIPTETVGNTVKICLFLPVGPRVRESTSHFIQKSSNRAGLSIGRNAARARVSEDSGRGSRAVREAGGEEVGRGRCDGESYRASLRASVPTCCDDW